MNKCIFTFQFDGEMFDVKAWDYAGALKLACLKTLSLTPSLVTMKTSNYDAHL